LSHLGIEVSNNDMEPGSTVRAAITAALLSNPLLVIADDITKESEDIETVTIIGKKTAAADIPGSAHVIDSEELQTFVNTDILRVLRSVPGVYIQEEEGFGLRPNIGIRGSGLDRSARIALLEDGVLVAPAPYAASSAYYFPTQRRMSAVEVLKGPAAVAVGPRTTGGAMNMISTPIPEAMGINADIRGGDHATLDAHLNIGNRGDRFSWLLETVQAQNDGFKTIDGPVGGDTGYELKDYIAKFQVDSDSAIPISCRTKPTSASPTRISRSTRTAAMRPRRMTSSCRSTSNTRPRTCWIPTASGAPRSRPTGITSIATGTSCSL
jgi:Fe(3+) dicitrate transport protein